MPSSSREIAESEVQLMCGVMLLSELVAFVFVDGDGSEDDYRR